MCIFNGTYIHNEKIYQIQGRLTPANETAANEAELCGNQDLIPIQTGAQLQTSVTRPPEPRSRRFKMRWKAESESFPTHVKSSRTDLWSASYGRLEDRGIIFRDRL